MVQLRVTTALQNDYDVRKTFQVPKPTVMIDWSLNTLWYPELHTGIDKAGQLNIFYDSRTYDDLDLQITNVYRDPTNSEWVEELTTSPLQTREYSVALNNNKPRMKTARNPITGDLAVAYGFTPYGANNCYLLFLDLSARYPQWENISLPVPPLTTVQDIDVTFDSTGNPFVVACIRSSTPAGQTTDGFKWYPKKPLNANLVELPEFRAGALFITGLQYGLYQDKSFKPDLSPCEGYYLSAKGLQDPYYQNCYRLTEGSQSAIRSNAVSGFGPSQYAGFDWVFLDDPTSAPLGFGLIQPERSPYSSNPNAGKVFFIANTSYGMSPATDNVRQIFTDVSSDLPTSASAMAIGVRGLVVKSQNPDTDTEDLFKVHAFAMFQLSDGSFQLWHTSSVPGGVQEVQEGIFDIPQDNWTPSSLVATDILSCKDFVFCQPTGYMAFQQTFDVAIVDNAPTVVVVNSERMIDIYTKETENMEWRKETVDSAPSISDAASNEKQRIRARQSLGSARPKVGRDAIKASGLPKLNDSVTTTQIYYVDITAVLPDGTPVGGLNAQIGSESTMGLNINGIDCVVGLDRPRETTFSASGKLGISLPANETLVPPSFWVWVDGMDLDSKVDIQPAPAELHSTFANIELRNVQVDNQPLVPEGTESSFIDAANVALNAISEIITGDATATPDDERYIYSSTSLNVARARAAKSETKAVGRLQSKTNAAFCIDFQGGLGFRYLTPDELLEEKKKLEGLESSIWNDIGDLFSSVTNKIANLCSIIVEGVKAAVTFTINGLTKVFNIVLEFVSEAAEIALFVFDYIKVGFQKLFDWLSFIFEWDDIRATARGMQGMLADGTKSFNSLIDSVLQPLVGTAFDWARSNIDQVLTDAEGQLADVTPESSVKSVPITRLSALKGSRIVDPLDLRMNVGDVINNLGAGATWLLQKFEEPLSVLRTDPSNAQGTEEFISSIQSIVSSLISEQTKTDYDNAITAMENLISTITDQGLFNKTTLVAFLEAFKQLLFIAVDLVEDFVKALSNLVKYAVTSFLTMMQTPVQIPGVAWIYENLMDDEPCTLGGVCCLTMAVPYTLIYKAITSKAPFQQSAEDIPDINFDYAKAIGTGIFKILMSTFTAFQEVVELAVPSTFLAAMNAVTRMCTVDGLLRTAATNSFLNAPPTKGAISADRINALNLAIAPPTAADFILAEEIVQAGVQATLFVLNKSTYVTDKDKLAQIGAVLQGTLGVSMVGLYSWVIGQGNPDEKGKLVAIAGVMSGCRNALLFANLAKRLPLYVKGPIIVVRFGAGIAAGSIIINSASK